MAYLHDYCDAFGLWPLIQFGTRVTLVQRVPVATKAPPPAAAPSVGDDSGVTEDVWGDVVYDVTLENVPPADHDDTQRASSSAQPSGGACSEVLRFDAVCVCSGLHNTPTTPPIRQVERFAGLVLHSSVYRLRDIFRDKRVLVVGCGETGMLGLPSIRDGLGADTRAYYCTCVGVLCVACMYLRFHMWVLYNHTRVRVPVHMRT